MKLLFSHYLRTLPICCNHWTKGFLDHSRHIGKRVCKDFKTSHPRKVINDYNFCRIFSKAWLESMTISNIYSLNQDAIKLPGECNFADKMITPNVGFTPFKSNPLERLHTCTSSAIKGTDVPIINRRPNCLKDRIKGPEVTASTAFNCTCIKYI